METYQFAILLIVWVPAYRQAGSLSGSCPASGDSATAKPVMEEGSGKSGGRQVKGDKKKNVYSQKIYLKSSLRKRELSLINEEY